MNVKLRRIAYARSGDKGASANVGVIARRPEIYPLLQKYLTTQAVREWFKASDLSGVTRYELPNLGALNFILHDILAGGGSVSLYIDAQGKALGQRILGMTLVIPDDELKGIL